MGSEIIDEVLGLLEAPNFCHLATLMPDGAPQVTPVWVDVDDGLVLINTAEGRQKVRNMRRDARVGLDVTNQTNPYEMVSIRGRVVSDTREGADEHIDKLAMKYLGQETYPFRAPGEQRVIFKIEPQHVFRYG